MQEIVDNKWKPNVSCQYILSQTSGPAKETVMQIANVEFRASWDLVNEILNELRIQFAEDHMIRSSIEREISRHPLVNESLDSLNGFIRLCRRIDLHKKVCTDLSGFDVAEGFFVLNCLVVFKTSMVESGECMKKGLEQLLYHFSLRLSNNFAAEPCHPAMHLSRQATIPLM